MQPKPKAKYPPRKRLFLQYEALQWLPEYEGKAKAVKCDVEECPATAQKFGIMNIPTVLFFKGGQVVDKNVGAAPKKVFVEKLEKLF